MVGLGYRRSQYDHCVYMKFFDDSTYLMLVLYVDDILLVGNDKTKIQELKAELSKSFEMKDPGSVTHILGMEMQRDRKNGAFSLSQRRFI